MPKLSINDVEYNTEDFNKEQIALYNKVMIAQDEMQRLDVTFSALQGLSNTLVAQIVEAGNDASDEPEA
jgi:hypothetical protein